MKIWLTAQEIADLKLDGFPGSKRGIQKLADREGWSDSDLARKRDGREGGGGLEYHIELLPLPQRLTYARVVRSPGAGRPCHRDGYHAVHQRAHGPRCTADRA